MNYGASGPYSPLITFLRYNKKWSLTPIVVVLLLVSVLVMLGGTAAALFIYNCFRWAGGRVVVS